MDRDCGSPISLWYEPSDWNEDRESDSWLNIAENHPLDEHNYAAVMDGDTFADQEDSWNDDSDDGEFTRFSFVTCYPS